MNVVQEINRINAKELESRDGASWHDQYKDSAYIYVGGLPHQLTEGDVITIFSQYGEVLDVSLPRDAATQKPKGFAFLMYADQRSTVLAVDNLGGTKVLKRTLRVDHVANYKQLERGEDGKMKEREEQSLAAHPDKFRKQVRQGSDSGSSTDDDLDAADQQALEDVDLDDPMRDYMRSLAKEKKKAIKSSSSSKHKDGGLKRVKGKKSHEGESKEERRIRREAKKKSMKMKEERKGGEDGGGGAGESSIPNESRSKGKEVDRRAASDRREQEDHFSRRSDGRNYDSRGRDDRRRRYDDDDRYDDRHRDDRRSSDAGSGQRRGNSGDHDS